MAYFSDTNNIKMIGEAILYSSIQFAIGSVEMSSKFSVKNFCKDLETLDNAIQALNDYIKIGTIWMMGVALLLYSTYGMVGFIMGIVTNFIIMFWIYYSYIKAFEVAAEKYNLEYPLK